MRSYTNKKGSVVEVTDLHLDTAVRIKQELQKASPSMKCSWAQHKKMMEQEGFRDSENSEGYRQLIKNYQRSIGELPSLPTYAEMVTGSQIESIKEAVGEMAFQKREVQNEARKLGKIKRDVVDKTLLIDEITIAIKNVLSNMNFKEILNHHFSPVPNYGNTRLVAVISDWHIGAEVDIEGNQFNLNIAVRRISDYMNQIYAMAKLRKVYRIDVVFCGDAVENPYMRTNQAHSTEFALGEQIAICGELIIDMLLKLSKHFFVTYRGFAGNHDRLIPNKNEVIHGDTALVPINRMIKKVIEASRIENLQYHECKEYSATLLDVNGRNFYFEHGDRLKKADEGKIHDKSSKDNVTYHVFCYGHLHHYFIKEIAVDRFEVRCGSIKGSDDFSETIGVGSAPSQLAFIVTDVGDIETYRIRVH
ncbi:hypothetical protein V7094_27505 [Priestia megaterium]|uniref:hypothetical protein n=1 Tax=Priestia megaterium TaxID=1404 RepID=UPI002FFDB062